MENPIFKRRSIRCFKQQNIEREKIVLLLKAAMAAPTARNNQEWEFIVVDDKKLLNRFDDFHPFAKSLKEAVMAIVVCGDLYKQSAAGYIVQDCAVATQNILLQATMLGLGSCWLGIYPREERMTGVAKLFRLPENILPVSVIALGYPNDEKSENSNYFPEKIHFNEW